MTKEPTANGSGTTEQATALDRLQAAYEVAKTKIKDANQALADVAGAIKDAVKENRQLKSDVENVRAGLAKLQSIKV
jgi:predicted  nucleic acid-binding Zn-ribbon protein